MYNSNSSIDDITKATVQSGETFAPAILVGGQTQKSIWYKFTLRTTRSVRVRLTQQGTAIAAGDAGSAVHKGNSCVPVGCRSEYKTYTNCDFWKYLSSVR